MDDFFLWRVSVSSQAFPSFLKAANDKHFCYRCRHKRVPMSHETVTFYISSYPSAVKVA